MFSRKIAEEEPTSTSTPTPTSTSTFGSSDGDFLREIVKEIQKSDANVVVAVHDADANGHAVGFASFFKKDKKKNKKVA